MLERWGEDRTGPGSREVVVSDVGNDGREAGGGGWQVAVATAIEAAAQVYPAAGPLGVGVGLTRGGRSLDEPVPLAAAAAG